MSKDKVVIVDNDYRALELLEDTFIDLGYEVRTADNGYTGVEIIKNWRPDLIILDVMMPGYDGYDVCGDLKSNIETRDIPILMLTAKRQKEDERKAYDLGADDYVRKPYNEEILVAKARAILRRSKLRKCSETISFTKNGLTVISKEDLKKAIIEIINEGFCHIIEKQDGYKLLYNDDKTVRNECSVQPLLRFLSPLMQSVGICLEREVETGRGPVDFKCASISYKAHIEIKRSMGNWEKGLKTQLRQYMESDRVNEGIYIVIWYGETSEEIWERRKEELAAISGDMKRELDYNIELIFVDARIPINCPPIVHWYLKLIMK